MNFNLQKPSIIPENINVEIMLQAKKGMAKVQHNRKPLRVYPYEPIDQTPKLVIIKNTQAPSRDPKIRLYIVDKKNFEHSPIKITLPQVNNVKV